MIRAIVQYESEPESERYAQHIEEYVTKVDCSAFRHGRIFGSPNGEPKMRPWRKALLSTLVTYSSMCCA